MARGNRANDDPRGDSASDSLRDRLATRRGALAALGGAAVAAGVGLSALRPTDEESRPLGEPNPMELVPESKVTHRAVRSGAWEDPTVWEGEELPDDGARALVESGVDVTLGHDEPAVLEWLRVDGSLAFDPAAEAHLRVGTVVTAVDSTFAAGTGTEPVEPGASARITFADLGPIDEDRDPARQGRGLLARGDVAVNGAETTPWTALATHPEAGDEWLELPGAPTNWSPADDVVVPGLSPAENRDEERSIAAVDDARVRLDEPLASDHVPPEPDLDSYVLHLSRNVVFASETTDVPRRGHLMVTSTGTAFRYAEVRELGRTDKSRPFTNPPGGRGEPDPVEPPNPRARYALHFHRTGPTGETHVVEGCTVRGSPGWGVVNHESSVAVEDCVTYRVTGSGFVAEKGNEVGHFRDNFALRSAGSGEFVDDRELTDNFRTGEVRDPPNNVDDFGHGGHGFWLQSPAVEVVDNVAAGHRHHGFVYWLRSLVEAPEPEAEALASRSDRVPDFPAELLTEVERAATTVEDGLAYSSELPIRRFEGNTCFASGGGLDLSRQQFRSVHHRYAEWGTIEDFTAFGIGPFVDAQGEAHGPQGGTHSGGDLAIDLRFCSNVAIRDCRLLGDGSGTAVWRSFPYTDSYLVDGCEISGWETGVVSSQDDESETLVSDNRLDNDVDVRVHGRNRGPVVIEGNEFADGGEAAVELEEIHPANAIPGRIFKEHSEVRVDGRTVYYDWSDSEYVFVPDEEYAEKLSNHGNGERYRERFDGDDPHDLIGKTTADLYEEYGETMRGGVLSVEAGERHPGIVGGFLGPEGKRQPTDEVWLDATRMDTRGSARIVRAGDDVVNADALQYAADGAALQLERDSGSHSLPVEDGDGVAVATFAVDPPGRYTVHLRVQAAGPDEGGGGRNRNRVFLRIDGGEWHLWEYLGTERAFTWDSGPGGGKREFHLDAGEHRLEIAGKGRTMRVDRVLVKRDDVAATPVGAGKPHTPR